jgi:peptidoglycan/xylan/chitin deacetylase (PgdA/CDA1 family)
MNIICDQMTATRRLSFKRRVGHAIARGTLMATKGRRAGLLSVVFHGLYANEEELEDGAVYPFQPLLIGDLRKFVIYFLENGYEFVTPADVPTRLDPGKGYMLLTFDDGYANNLRVLPLLRKLRIPATFFVSTDHVLSGKSFWWDALYRLRRRQGMSMVDFALELRRFGDRSPTAVESYILREGGSDSLTPIGELDRPMSPEELNNFAREPLVTIGTHTHDHALMPLRTKEEIRQTIFKSLDVLDGVLGYRTDAIAYPHGRCDERVVHLAKEEGLRLGFTVGSAVNRLPLAESRLMRLSRYSVNLDHPMAEECRICHGDSRFLSTARKIAAVRFGWPARFRVPRREARW